MKLVIALLTAAAISMQAAGPKIDVYKTATCGCCGKWVEHLKAAGFDVNVQTVPSTSEYREKYGVPERLTSCHTAVVNGYTVEGHVPAADIQKLLKTKPAGAKGLAVPGMPMGSPGMEGSRVDAYEVLLFDAAGKTSVFTRHP